LIVLFRTAFFLADFLPRFCNKTAGREELAVYFTSRKRSTRLRLRLTRQPPLRGGRRSPNSFSPGFAFGSPASRRCAAGAARRTRFHPGSPSAHPQAAAARRAPLAELVFQ